jgi:hypothetical protein
MTSNGSFIPLLVAGATLAAVGLASAAAVILEEEENERASIMSEAIKTDLMALRKWQGSSRRHALVPKKRRYILWDRSHARCSIMADYLGELPRFSPDDFKRIFRVSRSSYHEFHSILCAGSVFFRERVDATYREAISTDAKILISLKYLAHGTSVNAFQGYFQLGESTAMECVKQFIKGIRNCKELLSKFFLSNVSC